ncbi:MAG: cation transporter [Clostridia bacterium]|nr:cation transporter [Clostridia bacterium]
MKKENNAKKNILTAFILNFIFVIIELVGGLLTNSIAILSDSVHDFGDCLAVGGAYYFERLSEKRPDARYTYGYKRFSVLSALLTSAILLIGGVVVIYQSVFRIIHPQTINGAGMLIISVAGIIINGIAVLRTAKGSNINEKSIYLHMLEDALGWVVVFIGSIFIYLFDWKLIDPILSIIVTLFILYNVYLNIKSVCDVLLEKIPDGFDAEHYREHLEKIENVSDIHHVHIWSLDGEGILATMHVMVEDETNDRTVSRIKEDIRKISEEFGIHHLTIQTDRRFEECDDCECDAGIMKSGEHAHAHAHGHSHEHHHHH